MDFTVDEIDLFFALYFSRFTLCILYFMYVYDCWVSFIK